METWKEICIDLREEPQHTEKEYERAISKVIFRWGLKWNRDQIKQSEHIQMGSRSLKTDITLYKDDRLQMIVEVKRPNQIITERYLEQLASYMAIKDVKVGMFIGQTIEIFFRDAETNNIPVGIMSIKFNGKDRNGKNFVSLFREDSFTEEKIRNYYHSWKAAQEKQKKVESEIEYLISKKGIDDILNLISSNLISKGFDLEDTEKIVQNIDLTIKRSTDSSTPNEKMSTPNTDSEVNKHSHQKRTSIRKKIKIIFPEGKTIIPDNVWEALTEVVKYAGAESVRSLNIKRDGENIVSINEHRNPNAESKHIGNNYFVNTHSNTEFKFKVIKSIIERLNLNVTASLV